MGMYDIDNKMRMNDMKNKFGINDMNKENNIGMMMNNMNNQMGIMNMNMDMYQMGMMNNMDNQMGIMNNMADQMEMMNNSMNFMNNQMNNMNHMLNNMNNQSGMMNFDDTMKMMNNMNNQMGMMNNQMGMNDYEINQQEFQNILKDHGYEIIIKLKQIKNIEFYLIFDKINKNKKKYNLYKINNNSEKEERRIEKEIDSLNKADSKYIMKIIEKIRYNIFNNDKIILIILKYYENNLFKVIHDSSFLNSRNVWKIFIQIILGLDSLLLNNIIPNYLDPRNIYIDNENNIKILGMNMILDINNEFNEDPLLLPYISPEIIQKEKIDEKSVI